MVNLIVWIDLTIVLVIMSALVSLTFIQDSIMVILMVMGGSPLLSLSSTGILSIVPHSFYVLSNGKVV